MLTVYYVVGCDHCGNQQRFERLVPPGGVLPDAPTPQGWRVIDGKFVCDLHQVTVGPAPESVPDQKRASAGHRRRYAGTDRPDGWLVQPCENPEDRNCNCVECQAAAAYEQAAGADGGRTT